MNQEKAREFFSSYYEGTLDQGLEQSVAQALKRDAGLMQEFRLFERTYEELGKLKYEVVEVPFDLHDRIAARVDLSLREARNQRQPVWSLWARNLAFAGVAAAALVGAMLSLRPGAPADLTGAAVFVNSHRDELSFSLPGGIPTIEFMPSGNRTLTIREGLNGRMLERFELQSEPLRSPLRNMGAAAAIFAITVEEAKTTTLVAVPGTAPFIEKANTGSIEDFAGALAGFYRRTVVVRVGQPQAQITWSFQALDPVTAASEALDSQRYSVEMREPGLVWIMDH